MFVVRIWGEVSDNNNNNIEDREESGMEGYLGVWGNWLLEDIRLNIV